jgi:hypothetical protein
MQRRHELIAELMAVEALSAGGFASINWVQRETKDISVMTMKKKLVAAGLVLAAIASPVVAWADSSPVVEVVTAQLRSRVTVAQMEAVDHEIQTDLIAKRPGLLSRESAPRSDHTWLVIVHWRSVADADASMKGFSSAPIAAKFMAMIEPGSLVMKR